MELGFTLQKTPPRAISMYMELEEVLGVQFTKQVLLHLPQAAAVLPVTLGKSFLQFSAMKLAYSPPGHHSVTGRPSVNGLALAEYVIYRGEQAYPEYLITYQIVRPEGMVDG